VVEVMGWKFMTMCKIHFFRQMVLGAIRFYQSYLSPLKGFSCAYRVHTGKASCSQLGLRAVGRYGVLRGAGVLRVRLACCGAEYRKHHPKYPMHHRSQRGACDLPCDIPCDGSDFGKALDFCSCCDCGSCDLGNNRSQRKKSETRR
jgi:putative component of membrane protein insertase Oxa1/YidC/SpoIIIJ protein YidD